MKTIADIFLSLLEQYGSPFLRSRVKKICKLMNLPDWVEFFYLALMDASGFPVQVKESALDKGVDYIISIIQSDIEEKTYESDEEKHREKTYVHAFMIWYRDEVKKAMLIRGQLVKGE